MKKKIEKGKYIGKDVTGRDIYFASDKNISKVYEECTDFVKRVFDIDAAFMSDESSLRDFVSSKDELKDVVEKVDKIYGVNIDSISDKPLFEVVRFVLTERDR